MATDLSDSEVVLGKLAARLSPVLGLVACTWPVMAISTLLGGIDPTTLTLAFAIIVAVAVLGCAIALALSVWARKTHEVILATYAFWLLVLMAWPVWYALSEGKVLPGLGHWLLVADPFYLVFAPYKTPGQFGLLEYAWFFAVVIATSGGLVMLAVSQMRPVSTRRASESGTEPRLGVIGRMGRWLPGPSLDGNPVLWREWHRSRPSRWMMILVAFLGGTTGLACCIGAFATWRDGLVASGMPGPAQLAGCYGYLIQLTLGLLMLSVVAPLSMSEERQRGSLDVLAVTPLSTWAIVVNKWWGTFRLVPILAIGPGLMAFALATARRGAPPRTWTGRLPADSYGYPICGAALVVFTILAHGAAMTSIGLALATWIKRQVRAIVTSVCVFVLVAVAWPILASSSFRPAQGMASLSPIFVAGEMADELSLRFDRLPDILWWIGFWDVGVAAFAIGLLWLTWRRLTSAWDEFPKLPGRLPCWPTESPFWEEQRPSLVSILQSLSGSSVSRHTVLIPVSTPLSLVSSCSSCSGYFCWRRFATVDLGEAEAGSTRQLGRNVPLRSNDRPDRMVAIRPAAVAPGFRTDPDRARLGHGPGKRSRRHREARPARSGGGHPCPLGVAPRRPPPDSRVAADDDPRLRCLDDRCRPGLGHLDQAPDLGRRRQSRPFLTGCPCLADAWYGETVRSTRHTRTSIYPGRAGRVDVVTRR